MTSSRSTRTRPERIHPTRRSPIRRVLPLLAAAGIAILAVVWVALNPGSLAGARYFPETGYTIDEPFLDFFTTHGGVATFGYPLTSAYDDEDGLRTQVFQRAGLQLTVRGIELAPLGVALHLEEDGEGFAVDTMFADYYAELGGEDFLGEAIASSRAENNVWVQDFERGRIVRDQLGQIHLADLGGAYLQAFPAPSNEGQAALRLRGTPAPPPNLRLNVSVETPAVGVGGEQTVYVKVESSDGLPIEGARALLVLRYDGTTMEVPMTPTDARGFSSVTFVSPPAVPGGRVVVQVNVLAGDVFRSSETTYFQWW